MPQPRLICFNKPYGVLSQFTPEGRWRGLQDFIDIPHVYAAGRLDADSEGLLLLTGDGALQARIADPRFKMEKTYLSAVLEQATNLTQDIAVKLKHIVVDLGFRGVDADNPDKEIIHRGKFKRLSQQQKGWLKRRSAVEPAIGHLKSDHRMDRCWLQGAVGDALHSISCAVGYNLRWLMRAIVRLGISPFFLRLLQAVLSQARGLQARY